jgi:hypothetical protein
MSREKCMVRKVMRELKKLKTTAFMVQLHIMIPTDINVKFLISFFYRKIRLNNL